ncbi:MAG: LPS assembly lipoprotein LptE [Akkermansiaceae bacterium]
MKFIATLLTLFLLVSCSGYQPGGSKPAHLAEVQSVYIPLAQNKTLFPRAEAIVTNAVVDAFVQDGTYRLGTPSSSDASLLITLKEINYRQVRSSEFDSLRSEELEMEVTLAWTLQDPLKPGVALEKGIAKSRTRFFVDPSLQTARRNALPDALARASHTIVSRLADGF